MELPDAHQAAAGHKVKAVTVNGTDPTATDVNGKTHDVTLPDQSESLGSQLTADGVDVHYQSDAVGSTLLQLPDLVLILLLGGLAWSALGRMDRGQSRAMSFGGPQHVSCRASAPR